MSTHGYSQNEIAVWQYPTMTRLACLTGHTSRVVFMVRACVAIVFNLCRTSSHTLLLTQALSPGGETIVTGAGDETIRLWRVFAPVKPVREPASPLRPFHHIR